MTTGTLALPSVFLCFPLTWAWFHVRTYFLQETGSQELWVVVWLCRWLASYSWASYSTSLGFCCLQVKTLTETTRAQTSGPECAPRRILQGQALSLQSLFSLVSDNFPARVAPPHRPGYFPWCPSLLPLSFHLLQSQSSLGGTCVRYPFIPLTHVGTLF